ncbi:MAG: 4-(cytidine 5'-diphospho)-2-C-methyl-D-erythritol kinase [Elusimicrobiota bacterium]
MKLFAYAKVNLFLDVVSSRNDGYHDILTVFQQVDLADEIVLSPLSEGIKIVCDHPDVPVDRKNLVWQAVDLVKEYCHLSDGIEIKIVKNIPVGGGLGGGSSDAAAVLMGLKRFWALGLSREELLELGAKLGADVPFFVYGGRCLGEGKGEKLSVLSNQQFWLILVNPGFPVSTKTVYQSWDKNSFKLTKNRNLNKMSRSASWQGSIRDVSVNFFNCLEELVLADYPELKKVKQTMQGLGVKNVTLSGSGAAMFGWVEDKAVGEEAVKRLAAYPWQSWLVSSL